MKEELYCKENICSLCTRRFQHHNDGNTILQLCYKVFGCRPVEISKDVVPIFFKRGWNMTHGAIFFKSKNHKILKIKKMAFILNTKVKKT